MLRLGVCQIMMDFDLAPISGYRLGAGTTLSFTAARGVRPPALRGSVALGALGSIAIAASPSRKTESEAAGAGRPGIIYPPVADPRCPGTLPSHL